MSIREKILSANDIKTEMVHVAAWGVDVEVRGLIAEQRAKVMQAARDDEGEVDGARLSVPLIIASCYDPATGQPIFTAADHDALQKKSAKAVDDLATVALRLSGLSTDEKEKIKGN